ncbi:unnamed protein product [Rhizoctonia solani]|uniref:Uncharacterized protein n=1 Tax=Rhizoctonia solani TaxID=456999 RepID=A0A8H3E7L0_9AGAM|nr:unnamed protein product [Rhizoctonia solani]
MNTAATSGSKRLPSLAFDHPPVNAKRVRATRVDDRVNHVRGSAHANQYSEQPRTPLHTHSTVFNTSRSWSMDTHPPPPLPPLQGASTIKRTQSNEKVRPTTCHRVACLLSRDWLDRCVHEHTNEYSPH